jgi:hypothetical protein
MFEGSAYFTGPRLTEELVRQAEERLGYTLPAAYLGVLRVRNGGRPTRPCVKTPFATSWASNHFEIEAILGIGGRWDIDSDEVISSPAMIEEWGYPRIGIVICEMPSAGHDAVMLDHAGRGSEPTVVYIDDDRVSRAVAPSFASFVDGPVSHADVGATRDRNTPEGYT